jgi:transcription-repair coupling factor (superfamily II helicase)
VEHRQSFSLPRELGADFDRLGEVRAAFGASTRTDVTGLPPGVAALLLAQSTKLPHIVLAPDAAAARALQADLSLFCGPDRAVLYYPAADTTPFVEVASDRRAAMERLACLFHLGQGLPFAALVLPVAAALRRIVPRAAVAARSARVEYGMELDREQLLRTLSEGGYLRVPVVEDPGSFAVRGALLDVYPPHAPYPVRIELDGDLVASIKSFDPDNQRTLEELPALNVHPVRDVMLGEAELELGREKLSDLCDAVNFPTSRRRQLVEDICSGRHQLGIEGYLPAFHPRLDTLFDYLPADSRLLVWDPAGCAAALDEELEHAARDREARRDKKLPTYPMEALYLSPAELDAELERRPLCVAHRVAVSGELAAEELGQSLAPLLDVTGRRVLRLNAEDQAPLSAALKQQRVSRQLGEPLEPLRARLTSWLGEGLRVLLVVRTTTQAERLRSLLTPHGFPIAAIQPDYQSAMAARPGLELVLGGLHDGFVLPEAALVCVTEGEIFGERGERKAAKRKRRDDTRAFLEDLRELSVGDYVVHIDHGVGRYLGLEHKRVPVSRFEEMQGHTPRRVEALVVEYANGDKLYLPVTRLNQIEKFAGADGKTPRLDKLGGQTFARAKSSAQKAVRELADELLHLYAERASRHRPAHPALGGLYAQFEASFPFEETPDQARAIEDVMQDLGSDRPMDRLVCGDVGFGKTEVALRAAFRVALGGQQVALLCPTTVLAQQHAQTFAARFADYPIQLEVMSRFVPKKQQSEVVAALKAGKCDVVIGTHRLLSKDVHFKNLGLLVVDEEQRFGVAHKERIKKLKKEVDVLTLSATPIPRTLQLAVGGLRELSVIATPPIDRRAIRTFVTRWDDHVVKEAIERELSRGGQVFFIHNRIDQLYERAARLQQLLPNARLAVAHGQLEAATLERLMTEFVEGRYDVLCSTAIVESGLDIPRANTILIDRADMFGLAQLYQLRGRVGRSRERAYCYVIAPPPSALGDEAKLRIEALERFSQLGAGFQVASLDMEMRGAGELLGGGQSGHVAEVGFELFVRMLEEAVAELRGETVVHEVDPELTVDMEQYLPDDYVEDVGLRLSFYKRLAGASDEDTVQALAEEMEDRFGPPPQPARQLLRAMALRPALREFRVMGCEATPERVTLHLRDDTPLDPAKVMARAARDRDLQLTPDRKLIRRYAPATDADALDRVRSLIGELEGLRAEPAHEGTR